MKKKSKNNVAALNQYEKNDITPSSSCTLKHNELDLIINGQCYKIYGSSCIVPIIADADVYVSLDCQAPVYHFESQEHSLQKHIRCFIDDGTTPKNDVEFGHCLDMTLKLILDHKKVHVGCIGGHGRTGMFLSALVQKCMHSYLQDNSLGAIDYVRQCYCHKAVETIPQILYLNHYYGVDYPHQEKSAIKDIENKFKSHTGFYLHNQILNSDFQSCMEVVQMLDISQKNFLYEGLITRSIRF